MLPSCSCGVVDALNKFVQNQKLVQFLMELNDSYMVVRGNVLMMSPLPTVTQAYCLLIQEEKQREMVNNVQFLSDSASFNVVGGKPPYKGKNFSDPKSKYERGSIFCDFCKRQGHSIGKCFKKHEFPPNNKFQKGRKFAAHVQTHDVANDFINQSQAPPVSTTTMNGLNQ